jgi:hypothetical protein
MKKNLLLAASLLTVGVASTLTAQTKAEDMFQVVAASPGTINFSGAGTAQFNNSLGTNNSFQVGSSTNLGVNASVSSTTGYAVDSTADLGLTGSTTLKQVIGTSGAANSATQTSTTAHTNAMEAMASWSGGVEYDASNNRGYSTQREWQAAFDAEYSRQYTTARSQESTSDSASTNDGTISGSFRTIEAGTARASGNATDWDSSASASASAEWGASYESRNSNYSAMGEAEWQAEYDRSYNAAYANASAASNRYSDSTVNVKGIGSDASVNASDTSNFLVDITQSGTAATSSTSTANGSAGASLATSSFANQSSSSTASGFLQAFGGSTASDTPFEPAPVPEIE